MIKSLLIKLCIICGLSVVVMVFIAIGTSNAEVGNKDANDSNSVQATTRPQPVVIWFHSGSVSKIKSLKYVLSSGLVTHVMILYMHRADADWKEKPSVRQAIEIVKKSDAKLIWCRDVWPYYKNEGIKLNDFFNSDYYVREIRYLRAEAEEMGADFTALDTEPYGKSPMKKYLKTSHKLTSRQFEHLKASVAQAVKTAGEVDFVLPAGSARPAHPYYVLASLGKFKISEYTYYAKKRRRNVVKWPNEIFGAYINISRKNARKPEAPYFLVSDIFERSELWLDRKGVFLYTDSRNQPAVAKALAAYAENLPRKSSVGSEEPNLP